MGWDEWDEWDEWVLRCSDAQMLRCSVAWWLGWGDGVVGFRRQEVSLFTGLVSSSEKVNQSIATGSGV